MKALYLAISLALLPACIGLYLIISFAISGCVKGPDGADPTDKVVMPCPSHFGGPRIVKCFKNDCNWCIDHGNGWTECESTFCGKVVEGSYD